MQRVVLKFRKEGEKWASDNYALSHLEALISLWMYSYIYQQHHDEIHYHEDIPPFPTVVSWNFPDKKLLLDFLMIIGHTDNTKKLTNLMCMPDSATQNIVEIATKWTKFDTREIPRNHIPIFLDPDLEESEADRKEDIHLAFIPISHLFGHQYGIDIEKDHFRTGDNAAIPPFDQVTTPPLAYKATTPLFAYKYVSISGKSHFWCIN